MDNNKEMLPRLQRNHAHVKWICLALMTQTNNAAYIDAENAYVDAGISHHRSRRKEKEATHN